MTYRNRELASLAVVAVITCLGFASVYIARQDVIDRASLTYGIFFLCLYLAAHLVLRLTVPSADPYLLPLVSLLTAIGVIEIYRIEPTDALRQTAWIVVGLVGHVRGPLRVRARLPTGWRATSTSAASPRSSSWRCRRCR